MGQVFNIGDGLEVTRWWNNGSYRWTIHSDTLDQMQIVRLFCLLDPVVRAALLEGAERERLVTCAEPQCGRACGPGDLYCRKHGGNPLACGICGRLDCDGHR